MSQALSAELHTASPKKSPFTRCACFLAITKATWAAAIAGVDWVTAHHIKPAVANMSLGGSAHQAIDDAVKNSIAAGVTYVVSAGNDDVDACGESPARAPNTITVGSTTSADERSSFSNHGTCVNIFAPAQGLLPPGSPAIVLPTP